VVAVVVAAVVVAEVAAAEAQADYELDVLHCLVAQLILLTLEQAE
jgi:hypothetical protein